MAIAGGFWTLWGVFGFYKPDEYRCKTDLDSLDLGLNYSIIDSLLSDRQRFLVSVGFTTSLYAKFLQLVSAKKNLMKTAKTNSQRLVNVDISHLIWKNSKLVKMK